MTALVADLALAAQNLEQVVEPGFYTIDDENVRVLADFAVERSARGGGQFDPVGSLLQRGIAGSTPAQHAAAAELVPYYPDAPGGEGGPGATPDLAAVLDQGNSAGGQNITNIGDIEGEDDGNLVIRGGPDDTGDPSAVEVRGANAPAGGTGAHARLTGGSGDGGSQIGAQFLARRGSDSAPGVAGMRSAGTFGAAGQLPTADGDDGFTWEDPAGGGVTDHGALTGLGDDDHPQYTTDAEAGVIADASVATHAGLPDPHPDYTTDAEATALADASVATHAGLSNPHPTYLTQAEGDAAYSPIGTVPALADVLAEGADADGIVIGNLGTPTNPADAATKDYVDDAAAAGGPITVVVADITAGNLGVLSSSPTFIIAGPGAGMIRVIVSAFLDMEFQSVAFDNATEVVLTGCGWHIASFPFNATEGKLAYFTPPSLATDKLGVAGADIYLATAVDADDGGGDSHARLTIAYYDTPAKPHF